mmetsp:Transcript_1823/g.3281  ORF Transcript_1823/g.3281 Transcript_1823/m.3281 type:complete len:104 (+) Transcript_1823:716-1027(+)|eukprot:CAMPEP_0182493754 /NCGR_PEP_ID=MMETSP1321-20130603/2661_1 /TAXON_ID=91990 /ORGANISM="Bolidomonas sp., Strain RCC1657" /LENGTH=103 /DNA_ID=CAMNT_0024696607 /DNA_START=1674 /DNA_END=1985 /DNA_ORIENTATION=+
MVRMLETKAEFDEVVAGDKLVVVDFTASWCGPCQVIAPIFAGLAETYGDVVFVKVDVDANEETAAACEISAMPTFQYYKGGAKVDELVGASKDALEGKIKALM